MACTLQRLFPLGTQKRAGLDAGSDSEVMGLLMLFFDIFSHLTVGDGIVLPCKLHDIWRFQKY